MKAVIVVESVPHYFAARFSALQEKRDELEYSVISVKGRGDFDEFIDPSLLVGLPILALPRTGSRLSDDQAVTDLLDREDPSVVVVGGWAFAASLQAIRWARLRGRRVVMMSDSSAHDAPRRWLREKIKARVVAACDSALVAGRHQRDYIVSLGMPVGSVFEGYDVVDNKHFEVGASEARKGEAAEGAKRSLPERYLLASARFVPKKNLFRLIEAYSLAVSGNPDPPWLLILGDGPDRPRIEAAVLASSARSRIRLEGFQRYDRLPQFYGLADAFVHVATHEQWGLVVNEAAAASLPLIVSKTCGVASELVQDEINGFVVEPLDVADMARAIRRMIDLTPGQRFAMGRISKQIVDNWGPERFASELVSACKTAMAAGARDLAPWDSMLLGMLSRRTISRVV